jgi:hypothetical protein
MKLPYFQVLQYLFGIQVVFVSQEEIVHCKRIIIQTSGHAANEVMRETFSETAWVW